MATGRVEAEGSDRYGGVHKGVGCRRDEVEKQSDGIGRLDDWKRVLWIEYGRPFGAYVGGEDEDQRSLLRVKEVKLTNGVIQAHREFV